MANISDKLEKIIARLDGMVTSPVEHNYDMTIDSKVEHISKQLEFVNGAGGDTNASENFVIHVNRDTGALDKTWRDIYTAMASGRICVIVGIEDGTCNQAVVLEVGKNSANDRYYAIVKTSSDPATFVTTDGENGYPALEDAVG